MDIHELPAGTHICQIYTSDEERDELLYTLLGRGLIAEQRCVCCSDHFRDEAAQARWAAEGLDCDAALSSGQLSVFGCRDAYLPGGSFEPEAMLDFLAKLHGSSTDEGYPAVRIIGEMPPELWDKPGGDRILEYECRVSMLLEEKPLIAVCQYDARVFDGAAIMAVLKVHPMMIVQGTVVMNPFFVTPQDYLGSSCSHA